MFMAANAVFIYVDFLPQPKIECKDTHKNGTFTNVLPLDYYVPPVFVLHSAFAQKKDATSVTSTTFYAPKSEWVNSLA